MKQSLNANEAEAGRRIDMKYNLKPDERATDVYKRQKFKNIMTVLQSAAIAGPMIAPSLGSFIISHFSWHWL